MFPTNHAEVMAHLLSSWRIAANVFLPLKFSLDDYAALAQLSEPTRTRAELVKVAILLGRLAVGRWESWDVVQLPPPCVLNRLRLKSIQDVVRQTRDELDQLPDIHTSGQAASKKSKTKVAVRPIAYCNVAERDDDLLAELLPSLGFEPQIRPVNCLNEVTQPCIINCLSTPAARFAARGADSNTVIVSNEDDREIYACLAPTIALPSSYARIREFLRNELKKKATEPFEATNSSMIKN
jgi:hypothetical protein